LDRNRKIELNARAFIASRNKEERRIRTRDQQAVEVAATHTCALERLDREGARKCEKRTKMIETMEFKCINDCGGGGGRGGLECSSTIGSMSCFKKSLKIIQLNVNLVFYTYKMSVFTLQGFFCAIRHTYEP